MHLINWQYNTEMAVASINQSQIVFHCAGALSGKKQHTRPSERLTYVTDRKSKCGLTSLIYSISLHTANQHVCTKIQKCQIEFSGLINYNACLTICLLDNKNTDFDSCLKVGAERCQYFIAFNFFPRLISQ